MTTILTSQQLSTIAPRVGAAADAITDALNEAMDKFGINASAIRVRYFIAQLALESSEFTATSENLNYSAQRLLQVWPSRFNSATAAKYANNPRALGSYIYANRYGNSDEASGDGFTYRGRGYIQLTFKSNYALASQNLFGDDRLVITPDQVASPEDAALTAGWFWNKNNLNNLADSQNFVGVTVKINGGTSSLGARRVYLSKATSAIA